MLRRLGVTADSERALELEYERLKQEHHQLQHAHQHLMTEHHHLAHRMMVMQNDALMQRQAWDRLHQERMSPPPGYRYQLAPAQETVPDLLSPGAPPFVNSQEVALPPVTLRSWREYMEFTRNLGDMAARLDAALTNQHDDVNELSMVGYCEACEQISRFKARWPIGAHGRDALNCERCSLFSRLRKAVGVLKSSLRPEQNDIYLYEQVTGFYTWMQSAFADRHIVGSEYLGDNIASGSIIDGVRHEDAMAMSFADASFDYLISCDVFEHVPDIHRTLSEASRILRPGGQLIITVPFFPTREQTTQRAAIQDGELKHLLPPEFHRNPVSEEGSLVFYEYGWDFRDYILAAGFSDGYMIPFYNYWQGHVGCGLQDMWVAQK